MEDGIPMRIHTKRGYFTIEAAIFLPIFILGVLTLGYLIKGSGAVGNVMHVAADEAKFRASRAYVLQVDPIFKYRLEKRILEEDRNISIVKVKHVRQLSALAEDKGLISFDIDYRVAVKLPIPIAKDIPITESVLCRGWIGRTVEGTGMGMDAIAGTDEGRIVFVFPDQGTKYHGPTCTFVAGKPVQRMLNQRVKKEFKPCKICKPDAMGNGSLVYCYEKYGNVYHRGGCRQVDKYIISMTKRQAEERGYTPCSKCGGQ